MLKNLYFHKTNWLVRNILFPRLTWKNNSSQRNIYLTFDDGPMPGVTDFVLDLLAEYNAKATFFCVGDNIKKYPETYFRIISEGHTAANHTFNHLNGWNTNDKSYFRNIKACKDILLQSSQGAWTENNLFRPPYGKLTTAQIKVLRAHYKIIMWDVLSGDFDPNLSAETCLRKSIRYSENGSIIVFHDNLKSEKTLRYVLPQYLAHFWQKGYKFIPLH